ncbi:protein SSUH2 homolog [Glandiceps talaboti]
MALPGQPMEGQVYNPWANVNVGETLPGYSAGVNYDPKQSGGNYGPNQPGANYGPNQPGANFGPNQPGANYGPNQPGANYGPNQPGANYGPNQPGANYGPDQPGANYGPNQAGANYGPNQPGANYGPNQPGANYGPDQPGANYGPNQPGYNPGANYHGGGLPPPQHHVPPGSARPPEISTSAANVTEEDARELLLEYVNQQSCWGSKAAKQMTIEAIHPSSALHYQLETFTESRYTSRDYEPYSGGRIDGPENGKPPDMWDMPCKPGAFFYTQNRYIEIPHTANIQPCDGCQAKGYNRCTTCQASGKVTCTSCSGRGHTWSTGPDGKREEKTCTWCHGSGEKVCTRCNGSGRITCTKCRGKCQLRYFMLLTVSYVNHVTGHVMDKSGLAKEMIENVSGTTVFQQEDLKVTPMSSYPVAEINHHSARIVDEHRRSYSGLKQHQQRHKLRVVPVSQCWYKWEKTNTCFWVYGTERKIYTPDYPQQSCYGCCSVL